MEIVAGQKYLKYKELKAVIEETILIKNVGVHDTAAMKCAFHVSAVKHDDRREETNHGGQNHHLRNRYLTLLQPGSGSLRRQGDLPECG
jgi:hypothetical protein